MRNKLTIASGLFLLFQSFECNAVKLTYASDDMDDLLAGVIMNKHTPKKEEKKLGQVDSMV